MSRNSFASMAFESTSPSSQSPSYQNLPQSQNNNNNNSNNQDVSDTLFRQGVHEHAVILGMDPVHDKPYLWIAERSLVAPLPKGWLQLKDESSQGQGQGSGQGHVYYYNEETTESRWDHPCDDVYRELFLKKKGEAEISTPRRGSIDKMKTNLNLNVQSAWGEQPAVTPLPLQSPRNTDRAITRLTSELTSSTSLNAQLQNEVDTEANRANELHVQYADVVSKLSSAKREIERLKVCKGDDVELDKSNEHVKSLQNEVKTLKANSASIPSTLQTLSKQLTLNIKSMKNSQNVLSRDCVYSEDELKRLVLEMEVLLMGARGALEMPELKLHPHPQPQSQPVEKRGKENGNGNGNTELTEVEIERHNTKRELELYKSKNNQLTSRINDLETELTKVLNEIKVLKDEKFGMNNYDEEINKLKLTIDNEQAKFNTLKTTSSEKTGKFKSKITDLTLTLTTLQTQINDKEKEKTTTDKTNAEVEKLQKKYSYAKDKLRLSVDASKTLDSRIMALESDLEKKVNDFKVLEDTSEAKNRVVDEKADKEVKMELDGMRKEVSGLTQKLNVLNAENTEGKLRHSRLQNELEHQLKEQQILSENEIIKLREYYENKINEESKVADLEELKFEQKIKSLNLRVDQLNYDNEMKTNEVTSLTNELHAVSGDKTKYENDAKTAWKKYEVEFDNHEKTRSEITRAEFKMNESLRHVTDLKQKLDQVESSLRTQTDEASSSKQKYLDGMKKIQMLNEKVASLQGNIRVFCRLRPLSQREEEEMVSDPDLPPGWMDKQIQYLENGKLLFKGAMYEYDHIFTPTSTQNEVYTEVSSSIQSCMAGYRVSIFAFGQTGSGKTYTMNGEGDEGGGERGVNTRALHEMFINAERDVNVNYTFNVSVLEVYNETVRDLLVVNQGGGGGNGGNINDLNIRLNKDHTIYVEHLTSVLVSSSEDIENLMNLATRNRSTQSNNVNEHSSRSHLVLSVTVVGENVKTGTKTFGKLNLIDLAGSERLKNTNATGDRLKEAQNINKSLSALGDVVNALGSSSAHVPYRNSKLTFLLQDSLKANAKVLMFVNINPAWKSANESMCSLNFAQRCKAVQLGKAKKENIVAKC